MSIHITKKGIRATGADANNLFKAFTKVCAASEPAPFTDTERLEWLIKSQGSISERDWGDFYFVDCCGDQKYAEEFKTAREAIDEAMRREKGQR